MDAEIYFEPISPVLSNFLDENEPNSICKLISAYTEKGKFPSLEGVQIALIGINEDRRALENQGCAEAPDQVRANLYPLQNHWNKLKIADLGNIKQGHTVEDTYFAVREVVAVLVRMQIVPILIGGSQDLTYANYLAYENIGRVVNIATIDPIFDLGHDADELSSRSYLSRIILHQPNFLFNYTNIGYQSYFVDQDALVLMKNLFFEVNRLGNARANLEETEPMVRNADIVSIDVSAIRAADLPGTFYAGPNGFAGEEVCQICRYAGMSDKLSSIGFYELNPKFDPRGLSAQLVAQMIWYFIDGFVNRKNDLPDIDKKNFIRFRVYLEGAGEELIFLKSKKTDRWWIEIPMKNQADKKSIRHHFVPCSYADYQTALDQEIPDRWWMLQQKLMN
jgi:formiminoglutamase